MAWNIETGSQDSVDLSGLSVVMVVRGNDTLGYKGVEDPSELKSAVIVDSKATAKQREALLTFVKEHTGRAGREIVRVDSAPIQMSLDTAELKGNLKAGEVVKISTRKAKQGDCICSNEVQFYPPLAQWIASPPVSPSRPNTKATASVPFGALPKAAACIWASSRTNYAKGHFQPEPNLVPENPQRSNHSESLREQVCSRLLKSQNEKSGGPIWPAAFVFLGCSKRHYRW